MTKEEWVRLLMHLPWGLIGAALLIPDVRIGISATVFMLVYEGFNDWRKKDASYKDVLGIVWGFLIGSFLVWGFWL